MRTSFADQMDSLSDSLYGHTLCETSSPENNDKRVVGMLLKLDSHLNKIDKKPSAILASPEHHDDLLNILGDIRTSACKAPVFSGDCELLRLRSEIVRRVDSLMHQITVGRILWAASEHISQHKQAKDKILSEKALSGVFEKYDCLVGQACPKRFRRALAGLTAFCKTMVLEPQQGQDGGSDV